MPKSEPTSSVKAGQPPSYRLVLIEWVDSVGAGRDWASLDSPTLHLIVCRSVGWLVAEDENCLLIVPHMHDADEDIGVKKSGCGDMLIPRCAVKKITDLPR